MPWQRYIARRAWNSKPVRRCQIHSTPQQLATSVSCTRWRRAYFKLEAFQHSGNGTRVSPHPPISLAHSRNAGTVIQAELHCATDFIPVDQELHILRIVQEALANAARHSDAAHVWIAVGCVEQNGATMLHVQIRDDGRGFDPVGQTSAGWGLKNLQRRADQLHGALRIDSQPGRGAVIDLTIPLCDPKIASASPQARS
jgi:signal transduction histidine kinase